MCRLHQFATLKKIAEDLAAKLVEATELKDSLANICCESYKDVGKFQQERADLEKHFPAYSEDTECAADGRWGDWKLGRLPGFLYSDAEKIAGANSSIQQSAANLTGIAQRQQQDNTEADAVVYRNRFEELFQ